MPDPNIRIKVTADLDTSSLDKLGADLQRRLGMVSDTAQRRLGSVLGAAGRGDLLGGLAKSASGAATGIGRVVDAMSKLGASVYLVDRVAASLRGVASAVGGVVEGILTANEGFRRLEIYLGGIRGGGLVAGRALDNQIIAASNAGGFSIPAMQTASKSLASMSGSGFGLMTNSQAVESAADFAAMVKRFQIIGGDSDADRVAERLRLAMEGSGSTFGLRALGTDASALASAIGSTPAAITKDSTALRSALEAWSKQLVPDPAIREWNQLVSVRMEKLAGVWQLVKRDIGENGLFDRASEGLGKITDAITRFVESPAWSAASASLGNSVSDTIEALGKSVLSFARGLTGSSQTDDTIQSTADMVTAIAKDLSDFAKDLPVWAQAAGSGLRSLSSTIREFVDELKDVAASVSNSSFALGLSGPPMNTADRNVDTERRDIATSEALARMGINTRLHYTTKDNYSTGEGLFAGLAGYLGFDIQTAARDNYQALDFNDIKDPRQRHIADQVRDVIGGASSRALADPDRIDRLIRSAGINAPAASSAVPSSTESAITALDKKYADLFALGDHGFGSRFGDLYAGASQLADYNDLSDPYRRASSKLTSGLSNEQRLFGLAGNQRDQLIRSISAAIGQYQDLGTLDLSDVQQARVQQTMDALQALAPRVQQAYGAALDRAKTMIVAHYGGALVGMVEGLKGDAPQGRAAMIDSLLSGQNAAARQASSITGLDLSAFGVTSIPADVLPKLRELQIGSHVAAIQQQGNWDFLPQRAINQQLATYYSSALGDAQGDVRRAQSAYAASGSDSDLRALAGAQQVAGDLASKLRDLRNELDLTRTAFVSFGDDVQEALSGGISDALANVISGTGKMRDVLVGFSNSVLHAFTGNFANAFVNGIFGSGNDGGRSGIGGLLAGATGSGGGTGLLAKLFGGGSSTSGSFAGASGLAYSADAEIPALAAGGVVRKPQIALIGEQGPEAVVPLHRAPEFMRDYHGSRDGDEAARTYIVVQSAEEAWVQGFRNGGADHIVSLVGRDFRNSGPMHKALMRKSG